MSAALIREVEAFLRSMRQAMASRDMKAFRQHFWTNHNFLHLDSTGRLDRGWGAYEELMDQEFRYMESLNLSMRDPLIHEVASDVVTVACYWKLDQIDPGGREKSLGGLANYVLHRIAGDWKIVQAHYSAHDEPEA